MDELTIYAVRNSKGEYFRAKGFGGGGASWVADISRAKLYVKLSQARGRVSYFANNNPQNLPAPVIVEFLAMPTRVLDESERVAKVKQRKAVAAEQRKERVAKLELERAQRQLSDAQKKIAELTKVRRAD